MLKRAEELAEISLGRPVRSPEKRLALQKDLQAIRDEYDNRHYTSAKNLGNSVRSGVLSGAKKTWNGIKWVTANPGDAGRAAWKMDQDAGQWIRDKNQQAGDYLINGVTNAGKSFAAHPVQSTKEFFNEGFVEPSKGIAQHVPAYIAAGKEHGWTSEEAGDELVNIGSDGVHVGTNLMLGLGTVGKRMGLKELAVATRKRLLPALDRRMAAKAEAKALAASREATAKLPPPRYLNSPAERVGSQAIREDGPLTREGVGVLSGSDKAWQAELAAPKVTAPTNFNPNASTLQRAVPVSPGFAKGTAQALAGTELLAWNGLVPSIIKRRTAQQDDEFDPSLLGGRPEAPFFQTAQAQQNAIDNASLRQAFTGVPNFEPISGSAYAPAPDEFDPSLLGGPPDAPFFQTAQAQQNAIDNASLGQAFTGVPDFKPISGPAYAPAPEPSSPDPVLLQPTTPPPGRSLLPYAGWVAGGLAAGGLLAWTVNHARQKKLEAKKRQYPLAQRYPALYGSR